LSIVFLPDTILSTLPLVRRLLVLATLAACSHANAALPVYSFMVKHTYPHDPQAFTQGLFFKDGYLFESTGQYGRSWLRKVDVNTGKVLQQKDLPKDIFGEGATLVGDEIVSLTWTSKYGFVFDQKTFTLKRKFTYDSEGWGLASDANYVYMSDGSPTIHILDPKTLKEQRRIQVSAEGKPVPQLNELEMVEGELFANVWGTDLIARINPDNGNVVGWIDLSGLLPVEKRGSSSADAVLNGIAYDTKHKRLFVTGKLWPKMFDIELVRMQNR
jgi:glutamine cyclotransferase